MIGRENIRAIQGRKRRSPFPTLAIVLVFSLLFSFLSLLRSVLAASFPFHVGVAAEKPCVGIRKGRESIQAVPEPGCGAPSGEFHRFGSNQSRHRYQVERYKRKRRLNHPVVSLER